MKLFKKSKMHQASQSVTDLNPMIAPGPYQQEPFAAGGTLSEMTNSYLNAGGSSGDHKSLNHRLNQYYRSSNSNMQDFSQGAENEQQWMTSESGYEPV